MYLSLNSINKEYTENEKVTLKNINLSVEKGEFVCVIGPSGCGKSTLLRLVAGLENPTSGQVVLENKVVNGKPSDERIMMFQEFALYPWLTVVENVMFGLDLKGYSKKERLEIAKKYLSMVKLWNYRDYAIHQISGGMKQRAALARALAHEGKILLMDEPFSALDKQTINILREELYQIWKETNSTIIYVTHSVEEAVYFADRVVVMEDNPGCISEIVDIALPRPRNIESQEFLSVRKRILERVFDSAKKKAASEFDAE